MTCRQVFNERVRIILRETIGRVVCSLYLAQSKTLDWESRMRWSVILVFLLSLLFLSRNTALQISTLHCVDTMSNPAPHFKAKSHTSYISLFQSAIIFSSRTWVAEIFFFFFFKLLWCLQRFGSVELLHCNCSWKEQNNSSQLTVFLWIRHNYPLLFVLIWPHYGRLDYLLVTNVKKTSALFKYLLNCYLYKFNSELLHLNVIKGIGFPFRTEATSFSLDFFGSEKERIMLTQAFTRSRVVCRRWVGKKKKSEKRRNKTSAYEFTALFFLYVAVS